MEWSREHTVGIQEIDEQHKNLASLISRLEESAGAEQGPDKVHADLLILASYNRAHFASEETLMHAHVYPASAAHLSEHHQFAKALADLERRAAIDQVTPELIALIRAWQERHVMVSDRHLARHISQTQPKESRLRNSSGEWWMDSGDIDP